MKSESLIMARDSQLNTLIVLGFLAVFLLLTLLIWTRKIMANIDEGEKFVADAVAALKSKLEALDTQVEALFTAIANGDISANRLAAFKTNIGAAFDDLGVAADKIGIDDPDMG